MNVELSILGTLHYEFRRLSGVLDTRRLATEVFGYGGGSLGELLGALGCPFSQLHCGGNDARFTLKAALFLATSGSQNTALLNTLEPPPYKSNTIST